MDHDDTTKTDTKVEKNIQKQPMDSIMERNIENGCELEVVAVVVEPCGPGADRYRIRDLENQLAELRTRDQVRIEHLVERIDEMHEERRQTLERDRQQTAKKKEQKRQ